MFSFSNKIMKPNGKKLRSLSLTHQPRKLKLVTVEEPLKSLFLFFNWNPSRKSKSSWLYELEKKLSGKHIAFITQRRILPKLTLKSHTKNKQKCPRSCTLTAVYDVIQEFLIVGKRIPIEWHGSGLMKVHLDKAQNKVKQKVEIFSGV